MKQSDPAHDPVTVGRARSYELVAKSEIPFALIVAGITYPLIASFALAVWIVVVDYVGWQRSTASAIDWNRFVGEAAMTFVWLLGSGALLAVPCVALLRVLGSVTWVGGRGIVALFRGAIPLVRFEGYVVGWAGFLLTIAGAWAIPPIAFGGVNPDFVLWLVLGPGLATPVGQFAGVFSSLALDQAPLAAPPLQFNIRGLLVVTLLVAIFLSLLKLLGILTPLWLGLFVGWLAYQYITLQLVVALFAWRLKKRKAKELGEQA